METWMKQALDEALEAERNGEVPVGALAVLDGQVIARNHNRSLQRNDPTAHAEILVLRDAGKFLANYRLQGVELYVTIEPCAMCAGALVWARIKRLVFGARDEKSGAVVSRVGLLAPGLFNHQVETVEGILADPCAALMREFFARRR